MKIVNKRARFNYEILEKYEAGIVLTGAEARALRERGANLTNSFAKIMDGEVYLINAAINPAQPPQGYNPTQRRKLLMHKREIVSIQTKIKGKNLTLVPVSLYTKGRLVKAQIALAKPKRKFEKKEAIKHRDIQRDIAREIRGSKED